MGGWSCIIVRLMPKFCWLGEGMQGQVALPRWQKRPWLQGCCRSHAIGSCRFDVEALSLVFIHQQPTFFESLSQLCLVGVRWPRLMPIWMESGDYDLSTVSRRL